MNTLRGNMAYRATLTVITLSVYLCHHQDRLYRRADSRDEETRVRSSAVSSSLMAFLAKRETFDPAP